MKLWITVSEAWPPLDSGPWILSRNLISRRHNFSFLKPQSNCKPHSETSKDTGSNLVNNNQPGVVYHITQKSAPPSPSLSVAIFRVEQFIIHKAMREFRSQLFVRSWATQTGMSQTGKASESQGDLQGWTANSRVRAQESGEGCLE